MSNWVREVGTPPRGLSLVHSGATWILELSGGSRLREVRETYLEET